MISLKFITQLILYNKSTLIVKVDGMIILHVICNKCNITCITCKRFYYNFVYKYTIVW